MTLKCRKCLSPANGLLTNTTHCFSKSLSFSACGVNMCCKHKASYRGTLVPGSRKIKFKAPPKKPTIESIVTSGHMGGNCLNRFAPYTRKANRTYNPANSFPIARAGNACLP